MFQGPSVHINSLSHCHGFLGKTLEQNRSIVNVIINTCVCSAVTSQNVLCHCDNLGMEIKTNLITGNQ